MRPERARSIPPRSPHRIASGAIRWRRCRAGFAWIGTPHACFITAAAELYDVDTHGPGSAPHLLHGRFQVEAIEIGHLDLGDFFHLGLCALTDTIIVRL